MGCNADDDGLFYTLVGVVIFGVVLLYSVYLEYNAQAELERRHAAATARKRRV